MHEAKDDMLRYLPHMSSADENGQTTVEYALVLLTSALVIVIALAAGIGSSLDDFADTFKNALP